MNLLLVTGGRKDMGPGSLITDISKNCQMHKQIEIWKKEKCLEKQATPLYFSIPYKYLFG